MKAFYFTILAGAILVGAVTSFGQDNASKVLTMQNAFALAIKNSAQLNVAKVNTALAHQKTAIAELGRLPGISSSLNYGYLSNSQIWEPFVGPVALPLRNHQTYRRKLPPEKQENNLWKKQRKKPVILTSSCILHYPKQGTFYQRRYYILNYRNHSIVDYRLHLPY